MFLIQLLLPVLLVASISAQRSAGPRFCGTPSPTEEQIEASKFLLESERSNIRARAQREIKVDTYFHILATSERHEDGYVTQQEVDDQFAKITKEYARHNISFNLVNVTWTIDARWGKGEDILRFKKALRQGDYSTLNLYFVDYAMLSYAKPDSSGQLLGECTFPNNITRGSDKFYNDGCIICAATMPGGSVESHNLGKSAIHEIGHWFDLFHTFHGQGCEDGDLIDDTPAHTLDPSRMGACPIGRDSCPSSPGLDPIHNYMSYSNDACWDEFTRGQVDRMYSSWEKYRRNATD